MERQSIPQSIAGLYGYEIDYLMHMKEKEEKRAHWRNELDLMIIPQASSGS